jgi:hypothetical protein
VIFLSEVNWNFINEQKLWLMNVLIRNSQIRKKLMSIRLKIEFIFVKGLWKNYSNHSFITNWYKCQTNNNKYFSREKKSISIETKFLKLREVMQQMSRNINYIRNWFWVQKKKFHKYSKKKFKSQRNKKFNFIFH